MYRNFYLVHELDAQGNKDLRRYRGGFRSLDNARGEIRFLRDGGNKAAMLITLRAEPEAGKVELTDLEVHLSPNGHPRRFKVGDGATICGYSDSRCYTVIAVGKNSITLQRDKATLLNGANSGEADAIKFHNGGFCAHAEGKQRYDIQPDPEGTTLKAFWREKQERFVSSHGRVAKGRSEFYDYNF